jgi:NAD(P)-dependent dehydrogenase (short-subunit alcohol dehydrogenase family)
MAGGELAGRTALVTGGPRGIGRAVCVRLAQAGARVALNYVSDEAAAAEARALVEAEGTECLLAKAETREAGEEKGVLQRVGAERAFEGLRPPRLRVISATRFGLSIADGDGRRGAASALDMAGSLLAGRGWRAVAADADYRPGPVVWPIVGTLSGRLAKDTQAAAGPRNLRSRIAEQTIHGPSCKDCSSPRGDSRALPSA